MGFELLSTNKWAQKHCVCEIPCFDVVFYLESCEEKWSKAEENKQMDYQNPER